MAPWDEGQGDPGSSSRMTRRRKAPRWVVPFLRALERTGEARAAAADAGIGWSTAYARRRAHPDFAAGWAGALRAHAERVEGEEVEELEAVRANGPLHHP